jgi:hypothetical protein
MLERRATYQPSGVVRSGEFLFTPIHSATGEPCALYAFSGFSREMASALYAVQLCGLDPRVLFTFGNPS